MAAALAFSILLLAPVRAADSVDDNVVYGMYSGLALLMDVHRPAAPNGYGVVVIPGSGWEAALGYDAEPLKASYENALIFGLDRIVAAGYTAFVINHRATPRFRYPAPIEDAQRAVRFVRHHAADYGIEAEHVLALGGSSGGHLVALLATLDGEGDPDASDPVNRLSAKVQAAVVVYGVFDFLRFETSNPWAGGAITALLGPVNPAWKPPPLQEPEAFARYREASPLHHVSPDDPPFLLIHGDADSVVPFAQSEIMAQKLEEKGVDVELIRVPGGDHGPGLISGPGAPHVDAIVAWLDARRAAFAQGGEARDAR